MAQTKQNKRRREDVMWRVVKYGSILEICALHFTHPSAHTHTQQWVVNKHTHTVNTHTEKQLD